MFTNFTNGLLVLVKKSGELCQFDWLVPFENWQIDSSFQDFDLQGKRTYHDNFGTFARRAKEDDELIYS